jgi:nucleoside-diphosphate-sugar epimerase
MKAIVTGRAGFTGSHLMERLLQEGHRAVVLDDLSTGRPPNLEGLLGPQSPGLVGAPGPGVEQLDLPSTGTWTWGTLAR